MKVNETSIMQTYVDDEFIHSIYLDDELLWSIIFKHEKRYDGTYEVNAANKSIAGDIVIPSTYNGVALAIIGYEGFKDCVGITNVIIPDTITLLAEYAFDGCTNLKSVVIGNGVTEIRKSAFRNCSSLTNVVFGDSVTYIGGYAFDGCTSLITITIPDSVTSIGSNSVADFSTFGNCTNLKSVIIGNGVTIISSYAFSGCSSLTSVYYKGAETEWNTIAIADSSFPDSATIYYYSETQPTTYGNYWHYVDGVPTVWEIAISTYALDVKFARTAYTHPGSGQTTVGDVGVFNVTIPTEISNIETLEIPVWATYTKSGYFKLSLGAYTNANCTFVQDDPTSHKYTLTISEATGDVSITINGTSP